MDISITPEQDSILTPFGLFKRTYSMLDVTINEEDDLLEDEEVQNDHDVIFDPGLGYKFKLRKFGQMGSFKIHHHLGLKDMDIAFKAFSRLHAAIKHLEESEKLKCSVN